jgi:hypothetical protein
MVQTSRGKAFIEQEPEISAQEIEQAKSGRKIAISFKGKPVLQSRTEIGFVAVKFALADGTFPVVLLDRFSAESLRSLIETVNHRHGKSPPPPASALHVSLRQKVAQYVGGARIISAERSSVNLEALGPSWPASACYPRSGSNPHRRSERDDCPRSSCTPTGSDSGHGDIAL